MHKDIIMKTLMAFILCLKASILTAASHPLLSEAPKNPFALFTKLQQMAHTSNIVGHDYAVLGTVNSEHYPQLRLVYVDLKNNLGFTFTSHENTKKTAHLLNNPKASLLYSWVFKDNIHIQIAITGKVTALGKTNAASFDVDYILKPNHVLFSIMQGTKGQSTHHYLAYTQSKGRWLMDTHQMKD